MFALTTKSVRPIGNGRIKDRRRASGLGRYIPKFWSQNSIWHVHHDINETVDSLNVYDNHVLIRGKRSLTTALTSVSRWYETTHYTYLPNLDHSCAKSSWSLGSNLDKEDSSELE